MLWWKLCPRYKKIGRKIKNEEVYEQVNKADYVIAGTEKYDQELLSKLVNLKGIPRVGIGIDNIDLDIAAKNNIKILFYLLGQVSYSQMIDLNLI